jgi:hypothetical protein
MEAAMGAGSDATRYLVCSDPDTCRLPDASMCSVSPPGQAMNLARGEYRQLP